MDRECNRVEAVRMYYSVIPYGAVNREAYASLLQDCPEASVFHSLDWMPIYELFSQKPCQFLICAREGDRLLATMPVTVFEKLWVRAVFSSGFGVHGGPICRPGYEGQVIPGLLKAFVAHFHGSRTALLGIQDFPGLAGALQGWGFKPTPVATFIAPMPDSLEKLEPKGRSIIKAVRKSARAGIQIFRSKDPADFEQWQRLCSANYIAHGRRPYPPALYRAASELIEKTDTLRFYIAKLNDQVIGGTVQVFSIRQIYGWMSATDREFRIYGTNDVILQAVFEDAIAEGMLSFDFGPSPPGATGLVDFKKKWAGVQRDYYQYNYENIVGRIGANLVRYGKLSRD